MKVQLARYFLCVLAGLCLALFAWPTSAIAGMRIEADAWEKALDTHGTIMMLIDAVTGEIVGANAAAARFYGYPLDQLEGMYIDEIHTYSAAEIEKERLAALNEERNYFIFPHRLATGEERTVEVYSYPVGGDESNLLFSVIHDITERHKAEQELLDKNARLRRAEAITGLGSWELHLSEGLITLSEGARQILGRATSEHSLEESLEAISPDYQEIRQRALRELIEEGKPYDIEFQAKRPSDGQLIYVHSIAEYNPKTNTVFGTLLDITDWKRSEEALEASKRRNIRSLLAFALAQLGVIIALMANIRGRKQVENKNLQNLQRSESLVRILQHQTESVQELVDYALQESVALTGSKIGYIFFYDDQRRKLTLNAWSKMVLDQCHITDKKTVYNLDETGIWGEAIRQGKAIVVNDFKKPDPRKKGYPPGHVHIDRYMTLPVYDEGRIVAVIGLANKETPYDDIDVYQVALLMGNTWSTVERKRHEIALKEEKERLEATLLSVGDGVITTDQDGRIEIINDIAQELTGWSEEEAVGKPFDEVFVTVDQEAWERQADPLRRVLHSGIAVGLTNHTVLITKDGQRKHIADSAAPIKDERGFVSGAVLVFRDVTLEKARAKKIEYLSYHDQLTGLYNRRFMEKAIDKLDTANNLPLSIVMADLNGLKLVNDTLGHAAGDRLLQKAAEVLGSNSRDSDIVARWGGDEFILLLPRTDATDTEIVVSQMEQSLQMEKVESLLVSMSFGWETKTRPDEKISSIFKKAENHMYRTKLYQSPGLRSETIDALMAALFEKNQREEEHSQRVSELCQLVGKALGLSDWKVKELGLVGLFHDIGKIAVDQSTLNKPTTLSEDEWKEIRRHPEVGYRLLSAVQDMSEIASYVLAHHERWDGTGYPKGLEATEIPLEARIVGVADAYDAMISYRPYRKSLSKLGAIAELKQHSGTQFDPTVIEAFLKAITNSKH